MNYMDYATGNYVINYTGPFVIKEHLNMIYPTDFLEREEY
jgi:hypothetical protein